MRLPRLLHRVYAFLRGYFWLPCPICKENFGGHESGRNFLQGALSGESVCNKESCQREAACINAATELARRAAMANYFSQRGHGR